ncbi:MAG: hypothetical protein JRN15_09825 [Nitrososphaerota archaeon]|jgi:hypothetical protein|nr:hypothetical protein [Nitrososphaerota archaeon]
MSQSRDFSEYPEVVDFEGVGNASLKHIHLIALSLVGLGIVFSILAPPGGYVALAVFILLAAGYDMFFLRRSQKPVTISLYLRKDPVEASHLNKKLGEIKSGTIVTDLDNPRELGFRPTPNSKLVVWEFQSEEDAKIVAKRLLEYMQEEE